ncbi:MAG TPA: hypothetical protein DHW61_11280 [Lachnoclostridium phytofermentans]|uniref:N-(5'-phosphoribosyl)anthranilate isomerase n=1 Tax=Lachnoclostridium phytofermentans TaxID=66219 RepID=A0A3D2X775_9FIRM|nr:hypothetical protein [Lachnoclostridium sp.]HCL02971.1 hypothetical protein [Lachnoclostridium phytofermentans]
MKTKICGLKSPREVEIVNKYPPDYKKPYFIAGGLTAQSVSLLDSRLRPYGVDVSSGVESMGQKDEEKKREFLLAASKIS